MRRQNGQALVIVVVVMMILQIVAWAFLSRVNFEQRLAGGATRDLAALYLAEGGLQRALWILEEGTPEAATGNGSLPHQEMLGAGTFTIEALDPLPEGLTSIVVRGEVSGASRRVKALARLGPEALVYGLYGEGTVAFGGRARTYLVPFRAGGGGCRRTGDLAAGGEIRFDSPRATLNAFRSFTLTLREGTIADNGLLDSPGPPESDMGLLDLVLAGGARLFSGIEQTPVELDELQRQVRGLGVRRVRVRPRVLLPSFDIRHYIALAEKNTANAPLNRAVGEAIGELGLFEKTHSRYSAEEFEAILAYLQAQPKKPTLQGIIVVDGDVNLQQGSKLSIADGALVALGDITINELARLEVRHGPTTTTLPGIVTGGSGSIHIGDRAMAIVDGLILTAGDLEVQAGVLDVIGAIAAGSFFNADGTVVVRYDPRVLVTAGLRRIGRGYAELVSWQELP